MTTDVFVPSVIIRLALEQPAVVVMISLSAGEDERLLDWLHASPARVALIDRALELAEEETAA